MRLALEGEDVDGATERVLELTAARLRLPRALRAPVPSVLRGFSAPVRLEMERSREDLAFLLANDSDAFNRWDAGQTLYTEVLLELSAAAEAGQELSLDPLVIEAVRSVLVSPDLDGSQKAQAMALPGFSVLSQARQPVNPAALVEARDFVALELSRALESELAAARDAARPAGPYSADKASIAVGASRTRRSDSGR